MKILQISILLFFISTMSFGQLQFVERFETESKFSEDNFMLMPHRGGLIGFRTIPDKGFNLKSKLQFFKSDFNLDASPMQEIGLRDNFSLVGYDLTERFFYAMMQKGTYQSETRYLIEINLENEEIREIDTSNVLDMELGEFLVLNRKALFMGVKDMRPVVQIFDLETSNVVTVQGIYAKDARILQLRKDPELGIFDILMSKRDPFKMKQVSVLTFDEFGSKIREVVIDRLDDPNIEIVEGILGPIQNYQQSLIGPYGQRRREAYQGLFLTEINEFGEYQTKIYTLEDFPNFYNYLPEKQRDRKLKQLEKDFSKGNTPSIRNLLSSREVIHLDRATLIYNDIFTATHTRYHHRDGVYTNNLYRNNPFYHSNMMFVDPMAAGYRGYPRYWNSNQQGEYKYISAQFALISHEGNVIWDNSLNLNNTSSSNQGKFGEISFNGDQLHFLYLDGSNIMMSYIRNGEVIFENESFDIELIDESERIKDNQTYGMQLSWWFDNYFLLSGKQRIRFQNKSGKEEVKEVFYLTKIKVDGDQFVPEEAG